jgi:hypothetical protein
MGDELHEGEHEPLIERERFERMQAQRAAKEGPGCHREHAQMQRNPEYLLRGLLLCACAREDRSIGGYSMTPSSTRKGSVVHRYYRCIARDKVAVGACPSRPLVAKDIEGLVRDQVLAVARSLEEPGGGGVVRLDAAIVRRLPWIAEQLRGLDQAWDRLLAVNRLRVVHCLVERVDVDSTTGDVRITLNDWVSDALAGKDQDHAA